MLQTLGLLVLSVLASTAPVFGQTPQKTKNNDALDMNSYVKIFAGQVSGYQSYSISSPVAGADFWTNLEYEMDSTSYLELTLKAGLEKYFQDVEKSAGTLDSTEISLKGRYGYETSNIHAGFNFEYAYTLRKDWPDQYQVAPNGQLLLTNRKTYSRMTPEFTLAYRGFDDYGLYTRVSYFANNGAVDPNYSSTTPTHLTPNTYTGAELEGGVKYKGNSLPFGWEISHRYRSKKEKVELARDAGTGATHYTTAPNPKYQERNNKTRLELLFEIASIRLEISPFYSFERNKDIFQDYYTYNGHTAGLIVEQEIVKDKLEYKLGYYHEINNYTGSAYQYDPAGTHVLPLTDGDTLYKIYDTAFLRLTYSINKALSFSGQGGWGRKQTNYPAYVPGVMPANKSYDIDFSYENYYVNTSALYRF